MADFDTPKAANLGFPSQGGGRELSAAFAAFKRGEIEQDALNAVGRELRARHWRLQVEAGIEIIPSNDFTLHGQAFDASAMLDAVAPELAPDQGFRLGSTKAVDEYLEAKALGVETRPVLLGPVTWLIMARPATPGFDPLALLPKILPVYAALLAALRAAGAEWVQIDEPILTRDRTERIADAIETAYAALADAGPKVMLATFFGGLRRNLPLALGLPVAGLHVDLVSAPEQATPLLAAADIGAPKVLSLGVIDGRDRWRADLAAAYRPVRRAIAIIGRERVQVAMSCSLGHAPAESDPESGCAEELKPWRADAARKLEEVVTLARAGKARGGACGADDPALIESAEAARRREKILRPDSAEARV